MCIRDRRITVELKPEIFYQVLSEQTGLAIGDEAGLMPCIMELAKAKRCLLYTSRCV